MGLLHSAFLFDYRRFSQEVLGILSDLDKGNYLPVYVRAQESIQDVEADRWILQHQGTALEPSLLEIKADVAPSEPSRVGYCLLVILSTYLSKDCPSLGENWSVLQKALAIVGWSRVDSTLVMTGIPVEKLFYPHLEAALAGHRKVTDPYWRWVIPTQAYTSGWLPTEEIHRLMYKLQETEERLGQFDFTYYPGIDISNPTVIREYRRYLQVAYRDAIAMLLAAEKAGKGIFMVIS